MRTHRITRGSLAVLAAILFFSGCGPARSQAELNVGVASSLTEAFLALAQRFEDGNAVHIVLSSASTGQLAQQIRNGAPYDLFAAADSFHIDRLIQEGYLDARSRTTFAEGELVVIRPVGSTLRLESLSDLIQEDLDRIAIANPEHAPYGMAAKETLISINLWSKLEPKIIYGETVKQAAVIVATGNAAAGIVARSVVDPSVEVLLEVPGDLHAPILHVAAISSNTPNKQAALRFLNFMQSSEGQQILEAFGLSGTDT
ncbi:MAG: molybdate ABC transporter substrate-binding protein [Anaerolineales bacterium]|nr:MAG: molybdate ABC transporter substrate-binding protein [Anaerolineales bacterium]